jgi:UDP-N-acetyl-D-mannosaminuronic acid transferase (WecB/TagA/CpsF family)
MADYDYLDKGADDGTIFGKDSSRKIAFYGGTPQTRATLDTAAVATTGAITSSPWGFSTSTQANAIVSLVNEIRAELVAIGLLA